ADRALRRLAQALGVGAVGARVEEAARRGATPGTFALGCPADHHLRLRDRGGAGAFRRPRHRRRLLALRLRRRPRPRRRGRLGHRRRWRHDGGDRRERFLGRRLGGFAFGFRDSVLLLLGGFVLGIGGFVLGCGGLVLGCGGFVLGCGGLLLAGELRRRF